MKVWLRASIGLILIGALFWKIGLSEIIDALKRTDILILGIAVMVYLLFLFVKSLSLYIFMLPIAKGMGYQGYIRFFIVSWITTLFVPARVGEFFVLRMLKPYGIGFGEGSAALIADKIITFGLAFGIAVAGFYFFLPIGTALMVLAIGIIGTLVLVFLFSPFGRLIIRKYILKRYASRFSGFSKTLFSYPKDHLGLILGNIMLTAIGIIILSLSLSLIFAAIGESVSIIYIILVGGVTSILMLVPITVNGLGFIQVSGYYLFQQVGIPGDTIAAFYVIASLLPYGVGLVLLAFMRDARTAGKKER